MNRALLGELVAETVAVFIGLGNSVSAMYILYDPSPYQHSYWACVSPGASA